jgi:phosphate starvation-inducible PhoH-like protein
LLNQLTTLQLTLEPADNERLASLCGQFDEHLRQIERRLGVEIANRGNHFEIMGSDKPAQAASKVIQSLFDASLDEVITPERVHLSLQDSNIEAMLESGGEEEGPIAIRTKRGVIKPRGLNQQRYLKNIQDHDINFGVGPAGTGKTYLAVACAVAALEREEVRRLILARPAVEAGEKLGFLPGDMAQKVDPYLRPLYDALYEMLGFERVAKLIERNVIEVAPLAFMRGRAQPLTSKVLTPRGWREMGSLAPGNEVIGSDGEPTLVLGVYPQGEKEVYRVVMTDGSATLACGEHLWSVYTASDKRRDKGARVLQTREMLGNLRCFHQYRYELPLLSAPARFAAQDVPLDPYALGLLLGDGCITGKTTPSFTSHDPELVAALDQALETQGIQLACKQGADFVLRHVNGGRGGIIVHNPVTLALRALGIEGTRSSTKFIPECYLRNTTEVRLAVLQGLLDTDGTACTQQERTCRVQYSTTSPRLRDGVIDLVRSLGGVVYWHVRLAEGRRPGLANGRAVNHRSDAYILEIRLPAGMPPFRLARKAERYAEQGAGRPMRFIKAIEPAGKMPTQCIRVAAADSLYVTDDFILTHNTLNDSFIILDEAQNTTVEQIKMFLTRVGFGSRAVVTGDITQIDLPRSKESGLRHVLEVLRDVNGISFTFFSSHDVVRHPLVQRIVAAYEAFEKSRPAENDSR